jgi:hypothetical protein
VSIEAFSLTVPAEHRAGFLERARLLAERAHARRSSQLEFELSLRVLTVLCGAASPRGRDQNS